MNRPEVQSCHSNEAPSSQPSPNQQRSPATTPHNPKQAHLMSSERRRDSHGARDSDSKSESPCATRGPEIPSGNPRHETGASALGAAPAWGWMPDRRGAARPPTPSGHRPPPGQLFREPAHLACSLWAGSRQPACEFLSRGIVDSRQLKGGRFLQAGSSLLESQGILAGLLIGEQQQADLGKCMCM